MREYFCAYHSMLGGMRKLSDAECGRLFRALLMYSSGMEPDNLQGREELVFDIFAQQIDRDVAAYQKTCETNRKNGSKAVGSGRQRSPAVGSGRTQEKEKEESSSAGAGFIADAEAVEIMMGHQQVYDEAHRWGFPANTGTIDALTALIGQYGVDRLLSAVKDCGEHGAPKLPYLRKVLAGDPKPAQQQEPKMQRLFG